MQLKTPGGIERFVSTLATMLANDFTIEIVANYGKKSDQLAFPLPENVKITFLTPIQPQEISMKNLITNFKWHQIPHELHRRIKITHIRNRAFRSFFKNHKTDYIITDRALYNSLVNKYYHGTAKKIATDHNYHQNNPSYIRELLNSIKSYDALVVATNELKNFYQPKTSVKCFFIPNALDHIPSHKSTLSTKNLLSIGRLVPEKNYPALIEVMSKIHAKDPDIHLTIIGDGVEKTKLQNLIHAKSLNSCITLTGWLTQNQIAKYHYDSSLFVMTSYTEAFGLVLTEAMSYGLPCIAFSKASGARAQINSKNGFLIQDNNPNTMAQKILYLLDNKSVLKALQPTINQEIRNKYSLDIIKKAWKKLLN